MELLTGIMIAILIFYSGKLIISGELAINNFFSFLAAMMLAYQPVKTLTKVMFQLHKDLRPQKEFYQLLILKMKLI